MALRSSHVEALGTQSLPLSPAGCVSPPRACAISYRREACCPLARLSELTGRSRVTGTAEGACGFRRGGGACATWRRQRTKGGPAWPLRTRAHQRPDHRLLGRVGVPAGHRVAQHRQLDVCLGGQNRKRNTAYESAGARSREQGRPPGPARVEGAAGGAAQPRSPAAAPP